MYRSPRIVRRTALGLLAAVPLGVVARRAQAASPVEHPAALAAVPADPGAAVASPARQHALVGPAANQGIAAAPPIVSRQAAALAHAEFTDSQGVLHRLGELGRPLVLLNLWAAWCAGCLEELPTIRALAALLGPEAIDVVLLGHEMNWVGDQAYARRTGLPFRHWRIAARVPENVAATAFRMEADRFALPQTLVFAGRERRLVQSEEGSQDWAGPDQVRLARAWLAAAG